MKTQTDTVTRSPVANGLCCFTVQTICHEVHLLLYSCKWHSSVMPANAEITMLTRAVSFRTSDENFLVPLSNCALPIAFHSTSH